MHAIILAILIHAQLTVPWIGGKAAAVPAVVYTPWVLDTNSPLVMDPNTPLVLAY